MWINLLYGLFVISLSFGGSFYIFGVTPRQVSAIIMLLISVFNARELRPYYRQFFGVYAFYLVLSFLSAMHDGSIQVYIRSLLSQHIVAMVSLGAFIVYYQKKKTFTPVITMFVICGVINSFVCLLQYVGNPIGYAAGLLFVDELNYAANNHMNLIMNGEAVYLLGLKGDAVHNGYFQMIMPFFLIQLHSEYRRKHTGSIVEQFCFTSVLCIFVLTIFLIQERSCILFSILILLVYLRNYSKRLRICEKSGLIKWIFIIGLLIIIYLLPRFRDYLENSRFETQDNSLRIELFNSTILFIRENFWFGGMSSFVSQYDFPPHNILLNAFVDAGIVGFILVSILYFKQIIVAYSLIRLKDASLIACAFLAYTLNSLLHNDSIITGDAVVWILWGMVLCVMRSVKDINNYTGDNGKLLMANRAPYYVSCLQHDSQ